jgi:hypothetical protein
MTATAQSHRDRYVSLDADDVIEGDDKKQPRVCLEEVRAAMVKN